MCKASAIDDAAGPGCSEGDGAKTGAKIMGDTDGPEGAEGKVNITTPDKTNKTPILVSY